MLTLRHFKKQYPATDTPVLEIPALELEEGIHWIKGTNGSGKSSLVKSIAGLIPFEGGITVNGLNLTANRNAYTKTVNYAAAEPLYPGFLTGRELVAFYTGTKGGPFPEELSAALGVGRFLHQKTAAYSSGMMKKLSLVLAFTGKPALILLDEPLIALDVESVDILQQAIVTYRQQGVSFLITSHQPLNPGLVQYDGIFSIQDKTLVRE